MHGLHEGRGSRLAPWSCWCGARFRCWAWRRKALLLRLRRAVAAAAVPAAYSSISAQQLTLCRAIGLSCAATCRSRRGLSISLLELGFGPSSHSPSHSSTTEKREAEAARIREKYPDRVPVRVCSEGSGRQHRCVQSIAGTANSSSKQHNQQQLRDPTYL